MISDVHNHSKLYTGIGAMFWLAQQAQAKGLVIFFPYPGITARRRKGVKSNGTSENGD